MIFFVTSGDSFGNIRPFPLNTKVGNSTKMKYCQTRVQNLFFIGKTHFFLCLECFMLHEKYCMSVFECHVHEIRGHIRSGDLNVPVYNPFCWYENFVCQPEFCVSTKITGLFSTYWCQTSKADHNQKKKFFMF